MKKYIILCLTTLSVLLSVQSKADLNDGLVAHWSFDDCTAKDNSGNGHDGTINGNPQCVDGVKGKAFSFDGNSYISIPETTPSIINTSQTSIVLWIKKEIEGTGESQHVISKHLNRHDVASLISVNPNGKYDIGWTIGDEYHYLGSDKATGLVLPTGQFDLLIASYDGKSIKFYFNGQLLKSTIATGLIAGNNYAFTIGSTSPILNNPNKKMYGFFGSIDEARIYNRALTESEVLALYQGKVEPQPPSSGNEPIYSLFQPLDNVYDALNDNDRMEGTVLGQCVYGGYCNRTSNSSAHNGVDYLVPKGTPVYAICDGTVKNVTKGGSLLNRFIVIDHSGCGEFDKLFAYYGHIDPSVLLKVGDKVEAGDEIGTVADWKTNSQLHLGLNKNYIAKNWANTTVGKSTKKDCTKDSVTQRRNLLDAKGWLDPVLIGSQSGWNPSLLKGGNKSNGCSAPEQLLTDQTLPYSPWK